MGKDKKAKKDFQVFWLSLAFSLFVFITAGGFLVVDYQGRKLSFGDSTPPLALDTTVTPPQLRVKALGLDSTYDATKIKEALDFLTDFSCLPRR